MTLVDLDSPTERVTKLTRQSKWDISCVQWHPYPNCGDLFATAVSNIGECWYFPLGQVLFNSHSVDLGMVKNGAKMAMDNG